jgi:hypothetical protein
MAGGGAEQAHPNRLFLKGYKEPWVRQNLPMALSFGRHGNPHGFFISRNLLRGG